MYRWDRDRSSFSRGGVNESGVRLAASGSREPGPFLRMKLLVPLICVMGVTAAAAHPAKFSSGPSQVALIELYTSEGCSSCPPADRWLAKLRDEPGLWREFVPMEFHVTFWDSLGWKDRLSRSDYTDREHAYASAWGASNVYTPCFVRNGSEWKPSAGTPQSAASKVGELSVEVGDDGVCRAKYLSAVNAGDVPLIFEIHLAVLAGGISSKVTAGENRGTTLEHEFVVLGMTDETLTPDEAGGGLRATIAVPKISEPKPPRRALAVWVTRFGELAPIQSTGGWLSE